MRLLIFVYGLVSYVLFLGVFLYAIAFVGGIEAVAGFEIPKHVNDGPAAAPSRAILIDVVLLGLFALQHSVMARNAFKKKWTKIVPPAAERSTYVLLSSLLLALMYWQWRPLPETVWSVEGAGATVLWTLFWIGWGVVLLSTFLIDHFDLFGLRQVTLHLRGKEYTPPRYVERFFYRWVRHPLMLGFIIAFWAAPHMSQGRLLFAAVTTAYIVVAVHIEERTLVAQHGDTYRDYQKRVPKFLPVPKKGKD